MKKCDDCVWSIHRDHGYSNWTVEGTDISCSHNLNPEMPFDRWYGEDNRGNFAENCHMFNKGDGVEIDVDQEEVVISDDLEVRYAAYLNGYVTGKMIEDAA